MPLKRNIFDLEQRRRIYNFILKNPGLHQREISRQMNIPFSTLRYHLKYLEKQNLLSLKNFEGNYKYFVNYKINQKEKELLNILRKEIPRRIILCIIYKRCMFANRIKQRIRKAPYFNRDSFEETY